LRAFQSELLKDFASLVAAQRFSRSVGWFVIANAISKNGLHRNYVTAQARRPAMLDEGNNEPQDGLKRRSTGTAVEGLSVADEINALLVQITVKEAERDAAEAERQKALDRVKGLNEEILLLAYKVGAKLNEQKEVVGHGNFMKWLKDNCPKSQRRANEYMALAENRERIEANWRQSGSAANLTSVRQAQAVLKKTRPVKDQRNTSTAKIGEDNVTSLPSQPQPKQITLPPVILTRLEKLMEMMGKSFDDILTQVFVRGINELEREHERVAAHEAGHAVIVFVTAKELGLDPAEAVDYVKVDLGGSGRVRITADWWKARTPWQSIMVDVAGAVAQGIWEGKTFKEVWDGEGCRIDRRHARRITNGHPDITVEAAAKHVKALFEKDEHALTQFATRLPVGKTLGRTAWDIYSTALGQA
jgi:hypothetical protein